MQVIGERLGTLPAILDLLCAPDTKLPVTMRGDCLASGDEAYRVASGAIPVFAEKLCSEEGRRQQAHYDRIAAAYATNLTYPHTIAYMDYLDDCLLKVIDQQRLGTVAEICCGHGEAFKLLRGRLDRGVGVDISLSMLHTAREQHPQPNIAFAQGDATMLPLATNSFDNVFMLGGIHHVSNRKVLFSEIARILKPGGHFYYREPVSDFWLWRALRYVAYRVFPALDHETEQPLRHGDTVPLLTAAHLNSDHWSTHGFLGFCLFMNSDVLVVNRGFRFIPGIAAITRAFASLDESLLSLPGMGHAGLQVVGVARKPASHASATGY